MCAILTKTSSLIASEIVKINKFSQWCKFRQNDDISVLVQGRLRHDRLLSAMGIPHQWCKFFIVTWNRPEKRLLENFKLSSLSMQKDALRCQHSIKRTSRSHYLTPKEPSRNFPHISWQLSAGSLKHCVGCHVGLLTKLTVVYFVERDLHSSNKTESFHGANFVITGCTGVVAVTAYGVINGDKVGTMMVF